MLGTSGRSIGLTAVGVLRLERERAENDLK